MDLAVFASLSTRLVVYRQMPKEVLERLAEGCGQACLTPYAILVCIARRSRCASACKSFQGGLVQQDKTCKMARLEASRNEANSCWPCAGGDAVFQVYTTDRT